MVIRHPHTTKTARALLLGVVALLSCTTVKAFIPEESAVLEYDKILEEREAQRRRSPEEIRAQYERERQDRNDEIEEQMSRPPVEFKHFNNPRHPNARRQAKRRIDEGRAAATSSTDDAPARNGSGLLSPVSSIVGLTLFAAVLCIHAAITHRRNREQAPAQQPVADPVAPEE